VNNGRMPNWNGPGQLPQGPPKKGAANRQTDLQSEIVREIEKLLGCPSIAELDFEAVEIGGATPGFALGSACAGSTAQHGHQRSCGTATTLAAVLLSCEGGSGLLHELAGEGVLRETHNQGREFYLVVRLCIEFPVGPEYRGKKSTGIVPRCSSRRPETGENGNFSH
jgi:hypothetical protein